MRNITVNAIKSDLFRRVESEHEVNASHTLVEGSTVYCKFMELVQFYLQNSPQQSTNQSLYSQFMEFTQYVYRSYLQQKGQFNELALSSSVLELAHKTALSLRAKVKNKSFAETQRIENTHVKAALLDDLMYGSDSIILKGTDKIKDKGRWATHDDLKGIAEQLKVNLHIIGNTNGALIFDYPTVTLKNQRNSHWTTLVAQLQSTSEVTMLAEQFTKYAAVAANDALADKLLSDMRYDVQIQAESPLKEADALVDVTNRSPYLGVQRGIKGLAENKDLMVLLDSDEQFLNQLGTVSVTQGLLQLSSGNFENQIAVLSLKNQVAVLETILLLFNCDDHIAMEDITLVGHFLANVVKQIQDLQEDKEEHVPIVTEVDESAREVGCEREQLEQQQIQLEQDKLQDDAVKIFEPPVKEDDSSCNLSNCYSFFKKHLPSGAVVKAGVVAAAAIIVQHLIS